MSKQRIIAKRTDERWGYRKGDVLEILEHRGNGIVKARNITYPTAYGKSYSLLVSSEYSYVREDCATKVMVVYEYKLFGIPLFKKIVKEPVY